MRDPGNEVVGGSVNMPCAILLFSTKDMFSISLHCVLFFLIFIFKAIKHWSLGTVKFVFPRMSMFAKMKLRERKKWYFFTNFLRIHLTYRRANTFYKDLKTAW